MYKFKTVDPEKVLRTLFGVQHSYKESYHN